MIVFLDFEASSLAKCSHPIEVAWVFEDGAEETHLIRPAPQWTDWNADAQAIHGITPEVLEREGEALAHVAWRMMAELAGHDLVASAPSWDGKWLSTLLRAAGVDRRALRLRGSTLARRDCARALLKPVLPPEQLEAEVVALVADVDARLRAQSPPAHRALPDAREERLRWLAVRDAARDRASGRS